MTEVTCPWCEALLDVLFDAAAEEQTCTECLTTWAYETTDESEAVPAAA